MNCTEDFSFCAGREYTETTMKILAIETSCDETAISVISVSGTREAMAFTLLGDALYSQASKHAEFGGVYPNLAKREHQKNLVPLTIRALTEAKLFKIHSQNSSIYGTIFERVREEEFKRDIVTFLETVQKPNIDLIAVTNGPGLEPALWTGVVFAEALSRAWDIPMAGIDHMEGHIVSGLVKKTADTYEVDRFSFPVLGLLISGGHTEFVLMKEWFSYELVGRTKDDAVGEAYDKVARLLGLPYPGGPLVDTLARNAELTGTPSGLTLPRPMINERSCDFSFSGLKTAVLYKLKDMGELSDHDKERVAQEFQNAVRDVLVSKTRRALTETGARALAVGGGVSANQYIRDALHHMVDEEFPALYFGYPDKTLTGDNAIMIGIAAGIRALHERLPTEDVVTARGSQSLSGK